ncbi:hypothetical protein GCM10007100_40460 [Roseibacillus persicicus]|uniref:Uncharacterized protein n=2 Tax=Roseibacillus persicicus TaxID=454148 RepID=A0A918TYV9_9BACT|nr:hypothetical protein GCM10007100_40460 [Roseibacillus persicicus]
MTKFLSEKPPYTADTARLAFQSLKELRPLQEFKDKGYASTKGEVWQKKLMEVMRDGGSDSDLIKKGYEEISVFQLVGLGRDWFRGSYETSARNKKIESEYERLSKKEG